MVDGGVEGLCKEKTRLSAAPKVAIMISTLSGPLVNGRPYCITGSYYSMCLITTHSPPHKTEMSNHSSTLEHIRINSPLPLSRLFCPLGASKFNYPLLAIPILAISHLSFPPSLDHCGLAGLRLIMRYIPSHTTFRWRCWRCREWAMSPLWQLPIIPASQGKSKQAPLRRARQGDRDVISLREQSLA